MKHPLSKEQLEAKMLLIMIDAILESEREPTKHIARLIAVTVIENCNEKSCLEYWHQILSNLE